MDEDEARAIAEIVGPDKPLALFAYEAEPGHPPEEVNAVFARDGQWIVIGFGQVDAESSTGPALLIRAFADGEQVGISTIEIFDELIIHVVP